MTAPAPLCRVLAHPRIRGTVSDRVAVAEAVLVVEARRLAVSLGLEDVRGLLTGAALLSEAVTFEEEARR